MWQYGGAAAEVLVQERLKRLCVKVFVVQRAQLLAELYEHHESCENKCASNKCERSIETFEK